MRFYQFYPPLQDHVCLHIYVCSFFFKVDVSSHQTNTVNKLLSFFTPSLCWDPSSLHCLTHPPQAAALLATGTGRQDLLRAFCRLCRASALALRGARRRGDGERLPRRHIFFGEFCVYHREHVEPNKMEVTGSDDFPVQLGEFFGSISGMYGQMIFDLMCVYAGLVCQYLFLLVG